MPAADPQGEKVRLRRQMHVRLGAVTRDEARAAGAAIADRLGLWTAWREAACVGLFASRLDEVDTHFLIERAIRDGKQLLLPRMTDVVGLEFAIVSDPSQLRPGRFGIREPDPDSPVVQLDRGTLLLVPGLAFDRNGGRLGRGGGYYDRALERVPNDDQHRPTMIGIGFAFQILERVPMTPLDVRLDGVVSDDELAETNEYRVRVGRTQRGTRGPGRDE